MRHLLLHPTHRKLIRLLRFRIQEDYPLFFTQTDIKAFHTVMQGTMTMMERHKKIYRLLLTAAYRPIEEIDKTENVCLVGNKFINDIERCFAQAERRHLGTTLLGGYLVPALQWIINKRK